MDHRLRVGITLAFLGAVAGMYFILGGCNASRDRSCVGALLAITAGVAADYDEACRSGPCPLRDAWRKELDAPTGWKTRRKCPSGGTYTIEVLDAGELNRPNAYRVVCSVHGDLQTARKLIDRATYDRLRSMIAIGYRPE